MTIVEFNLINSQDNQFYSRIYVSPMVSPVSYSGSLVVGDAVTIITNEQYPVQTINLVPNQYRVRCIGWNNKYDTEFFIVVPETNGGTVNAANITTGSFVSGSWITMSYAISSSYAVSAVSASYAPGENLLPDITDDIVHHRIGINNTTPAYQLDVGNIGRNVNGYAQYIGFGDTLGNMQIVAGGLINISTTNGYLIIDATGQIYNNSMYYGDYWMGTNGTSSYINANGGLFGIATRSPNYTLDVNGDINYNGTLYYKGTPFLPDIYDNHDSLVVGINQPNPLYTLDINGDIGDSFGGEYYIGRNGDNSYFNAINGGNFGICTAIPSYNLDINGTVGNSTDGTWAINSNFQGNGYFVNGQIQLFNGSNGAQLRIGDGTGYQSNGAQLDIAGTIAICADGECDFGNGGFADPSPGASYDVKCGGSSGGITSIGGINANGGYMVNNVTVIDSDANTFFTTVSASAITANLFFGTASYSKSGSYAVSSSYAPFPSVITASYISPSAWTSLTYGSSVTWSAAPNVYEDRRMMTLSGSATMSISNLYNGWAGSLLLTQSGSGTFGLNLPSGTKVINSGNGQITLATGSGAISLLGLEYNGTNLFAAVGTYFS